MNFNFKNRKGNTIKIINEPKDPLTNRISIGGHNPIGYYLAYRGEIDDIEEILEDTLKAFKLYKAIKNN